jgi:hypothetical protein
VVELSSTTIVEKLHLKNRIINGVAVIASRIPEISLSLSSGILARICLEFTAITINTPTEIAAPINAPLISMKVNAASAVTFSADSSLQS